MTTDQIAEAIEKAALMATPGPWTIDKIENEGAYGSGPDADHGFISYAVGAGPDNDWKSICDTLNSDATVDVEYDEDGTHSWDEVGRRNTAFIAAANPANVLALLAERRELLAKVERYEKAFKMDANSVLTRIVVNGVEFVPAALAGKDEA